MYRDTAAAGWVFVRTSYSVINTCYSGTGMCEVGDKAAIQLAACIQYTPGVEKLASSRTPGV